MIGAKKFILIFIVFSVLPFISYSYLVLFQKNLYMSLEYPMWENVKNNVHKKHKKDIDILYIGDSRAKAGFIVNEYKDKNIINLSIGGSTPIEGYYSLKNILKNNTIRAVLLSYAPFHISSVDSYWSRTVKFNYLSNLEYQEIGRKAKELNNKLFFSKNFRDYKMKPGLYFEEFKNGIKSSRWKGNFKAKKDLVKSNGHFYFGKNKISTGLNAETRRSTFIALDMNDHYLKELLKLSKNNNIKVYWYTMPFNESSYKKLTDIYIDSYEKYINSFSDQMTILNKLYFLPDENFGDPSHLYLGAEFVTKDIIKKLADQD